MQQVIELLAKALVDTPDQVTVSELNGEECTVLELRTAPEETGQVIGKNGHIAAAFRTLLAAAGGKRHRRYTLEILEC